MSAESRTRIHHGLAAAAGFAVFAVTLFYAGYADWWMAAQYGVGTALAIYFLAHLRDPGTTDGGF